MYLWCVQVGLIWWSSDRFMTVQSEVLHLCMAAPPSLQGQCSFQARQRAFQQQSPFRTAVSALWLSVAASNYKEENANAVSLLLALWLH